MSNQPNLLPSGLPRIESLEMRGITKRFPGVLANDNVDFDIKAGKIHALLGENGAGKSTLMKILYGLYQPNEGEILLNGQPIKIHSPNDSISHGIGMIHQHFMLVDNLTVAENVALGLTSTREPRLDLDVVTRRINELAHSYGLNINPNAIISELAVGQQQRVEIVKALYRGAALLVLDEPTAVLTPQEVDELFVILKQMAADGHALIFISHKLQRDCQPDRPGDGAARWPGGRYAADRRGHQARSGADDGGARGATGAGSPPGPIGGGAAAAGSGQRGQSRRDGYPQKCQL
jgi:simple sugar transport system ATP-binding protein